MSLRIRLIVSIFLATVLAWGAAALLGYRDMRSEIDRLYDTHLTESALAILQQAIHEQREWDLRHEEFAGEAEDVTGSAAASQDKESEEIGADGHGLAEIKTRGDLFEKRLIFQVWSAQGRLLINSDDGVAMTGVPDGFSTLDDPVSPLRVYSRWSSDKKLKVVVAESMVARQNLALESVYKMLSPILWVVVPLLILLALIVSISLKSIRRLSVEVSRRSFDDLTPIDESDIPLELRPMIAALNALFARLGKALENERSFTADAAHELRTPLAAIKVQAQVALREKNDDARQRALEATSLGVDRATHLVEQLLTLARLDPETSLPTESVSLRSVAIGVMQEFAPMALGKAVEIELVDGADLNVSGHPAMLHLLMRNLVDNAVRYTPSGGKVSVAVERRDGGVELWVRDTGPGLTQDQMAVVGRRFSRLRRPSGEGSGLGLSIVQRIAELHHALFKIDRCTDGPGLLVRVLFPL